MMKKLKNTDILFLVTLSLGMLVHIFFVLVAPFLYDESFYAAVPFRLVMGESLIQHEWNLTQFSSLFQYLPVYIWTTIKGSAEGIILFLRCTYLFIHTTIAVVIYRFFREHGKWAILASMMFYAQVPYGLLAISYHSMLVVFMTLLSLCLISIYKKQAVHLYVLAGICFGCCCVCNPFICFTVPLYFLACAFWTKQQALIDKALDIKFSRTSQKGKKLTKKQKQKQKQLALDALPNIEKNGCFFTPKAILHFIYGICTVAVIAMVFFFATGGTIDSIIRNMENLLNSSEYDIVSQSVFSKLIETWGYFSKANLGMPWILPLLFIVMLFDNKRRCNKHRFAYLFVALIWSIIFVFAVTRGHELNAFSLPFCVISFVCYALTENKNKTLFYCVSMPCFIIASLHYIAANTHLAAIGVVLAVHNVAGVLFAKDLWKEVRSVSNNSDDTSKGKGLPWLCSSIIIIGFCIQILFYVLYYQSGQIPGKDAIKVTVGPYSGLYMTYDAYENYTKSINDVDYIKTITEKDEPVLLIGFENWMYLHAERPFATYTIWYEGALNVDANQLINYYKENLDKIPEYVYIVVPDNDNDTAPYIMGKLDDVFEFSKDERLSNGVLLTVEHCKF